MVRIFQSVHVAVSKAHNIHRRHILAVCFHLFQGFVFLGSDHTAIHEFLFQDQIHHLFLHVCLESRRLDLNVQPDIIFLGKCNHLF